MNNMDKVKSTGVSIFKIGKSISEVFLFTTCLSFMMGPYFFGFIDSTFYSLMAVFGGLLFGKYLTPKGVDMVNGYIQPKLTPGQKKYFSPTVNRLLIDAAIGGLGLVLITYLSAQLSPPLIYAAYAALTTEVLYSLNASQDDTETWFSKALGWILSLMGVALVTDTYKIIWEVFANTVVDITSAGLAMLPYTLNSKLASAQKIAETAGAEVVRLETLIGANKTNATLNAAYEAAKKYADEAVKNVTIVAEEFNKSGIKLTTPYTPTQIDKSQTYVGKTIDYITQISTKFTDNFNSYFSGSGAGANATGTGANATGTGTGAGAGGESASSMYQTFSAMYNSAYEYARAAKGQLRTLLKGYMPENNIILIMSIVGAIIFVFAISYYFYQKYKSAPNKTYVNNTNQIILVDNITAAQIGMMNRIVDIINNSPKDEPIQNNIFGAVYAFKTSVERLRMKSVYSEYIMNLSDTYLNQIRGQQLDQIKMLTINMFSEMLNKFQQYISLLKNGANDKTLFEIHSMMLKYSPLLSSNINLLESKKKLSDNAINKIGNSIMVAKGLKKSTKNKKNKRLYR